MGSFSTRLLRDSGPLLLAVLAGCGGRTSTLDAPGVEANEPNEPNDRGSSGKASSAGNAPAAGAGGRASSGGATSTGTAGSSTSGGANAIASNTLRACKDQCSDHPDWGCPPAVSYCLSPCMNKFGDPSCQGPAVAAIGCLSAANQQSDSCAEFDARREDCNDLRWAYRRCVEAVTVPVSIPAPEPAPGQCSDGGNTGPVSCSYERKCADGRYDSVTCKQDGLDQSVCSCSSVSSDGTGPGPGTDSPFSVFESVPIACNFAWSDCGFIEF